MDRLAKRERQAAIVRRLGSAVAVRISGLARDFGVTTETIRRDLDALAERGLIARTYGGAAQSLSGEPAVATRARLFVPERLRIASLAASLVEPGDVLMIDAGSTTAHFAAALAGLDIELTVLTNSLAVARAAAVSERIAVLLCPGALRASEDAVYGTETAAFLERFHADVAVIGAGGVSTREVTDADDAAVPIKLRMIDRARRAWLLADHSKLGVEQFATVCALGVLDAVITDRAPDSLLARPLAESGVAVHVAGRGREAAA